MIFFPSRRSFLQGAGLSALALGTPWAFAEIAPHGLPRSSPEAEGVAGEGILAFLDAVDQAGFEFHSLMMLRHGKVIAEGWWDPYGPDFVHTMYSMSKSFTSTAVGFAVKEGRLRVTDRVVSFFPQDVPWHVTENLAAMRIQDLLTMSTGHEREPTQACVKSENWARTFLSLPIAHRPGTQFMYNSAATYMCAAIVQRVTGQKILDYLTPRLFAPLGITGMRWETCPRGINTGGWGLSIQTEGLAKFGQLLLQNGSWNGTQLLPAAWIEEASRFHIQQPGADKPDRPQANNDWLQGYGYQFWRCQHGAFRGDGAFGQFTIVLPKQDAVVVMTSENKNMQGQLDLVWKHLLPAIDAKPVQPKPADLSRLRKLQILPPAGSKTSPQARNRTYKLEPNELGLDTVSFAFEGERCLFTAGAHAIACGLGSWLRSESAFPGTPPRLISGGKPKDLVTSKIAAAAAWSDEQTLVMTWRYFETPHHDTVTCRFEGDRIVISFLNSITGMNPKAKDVRAPLVGVVA